MATPLEANRQPVHVFELAHKSVSMNVLGDRVADLDWGRVLERLCFLFPPVIGVGAIGVVQDLDPGVPGLQWTLVLVASFGYAVVTAGVLVAIGLDTRRLSHQGAWQPRRVPYLLAALVAAPLAGVVYLSRRHRRLGTPAGWSGWWVVLIVTLVTSLSGLLAIAIGLVLNLPGLLLTGAGIAGTIAVGVFPVAIHQDAAYVSGQGDSWQPNPGTYLGFAFASLFVPVVQPVLVVYYLIRRWRWRRE